MAGQKTMFSLRNKRRLMQNSVNLNKYGTIFIIFPLLVMLKFTVHITTVHLFTCVAKAVTSRPSRESSESQFYWHCLGVRYRTPRLRGYGSGTGHRATPMRTVSGSGSLWNNYSARLGLRGWVSVPARICSNCYFTNKNSCWSLTLLRPPSLIICIYCHAIQTSISLYKRYKIFNGREWKKTTRYRSSLSYFIPFIFIILIFSIRSWIKVINVRGNLLSHQWIGVGFDVL